MAAARSESIGNFLKRAFPRGTIPFPRPSHPRDPTAGLHYAFNLLRWEAEKEEQLLEARKSEGKLISAWPLWPPDMFAVTATLLEQSSSYLRMVHCEEGPSAPDGGDHPFDAEKVVAATVRCKSLCFDDEVLKVCRVIGVLWREGALFVSGDGGQEKPLHPALSRAILKQSRLRCKSAIDKLETRFHGEYKDDREIDKICADAVEWFKSQFIPFSNELEDDAEPVVPDLVLPKVLTEELKHQLSGDGYNRPPLGRDVGDEHYSGRFEVVLCLWAIGFLDVLWTKLADCNQDYVLGSDVSGLVEEWQISCALLLAISDEASRSLGFTRYVNEEDQGAAKPALLDVDKKQLVDSDTIGLTCRDLWQVHAGLMNKQGVRPRNLARCVDESVATVMPKARVPAPGCTIRSLSHHLALLPPKGRIRTRWTQQWHVADHPTFNLLLVPYPFEIRSSDVEPLSLDMTPANRDKDWGRFSIKPGWLLRRPPEKPASEKFGLAEAKDQFLDFVTALIEDQPQGVINGIVFPEGALTHDFLMALAQLILNRQEWGSITLLTSGLTNRPTADPATMEDGNFVATFMRDQVENVWYIQHTRSKHHRWSVNKSQLASYALSNRLPPHRIWWENINLPPREMLFAEFSRGSVLTSLICEDLARIDPCQDALRAIGPNLTLVLLMDSAQIPGRWPAQYAGVLADDPGTSVLTLTSFGLLRRSNFSDGHNSRAIALWREPNTTARSIELPPGHQAQLLSLRRERRREVTLDGRGDGNSAIMWSLAGVVPIRVDRDRLPPGYPRDD